MADLLAATDERVPDPSPRLPAGSSSGAPSAPSQPATAAENDRPENIAQYEVEHKIGEGTYGVVYRAIDITYPVPDPLPAVRTDDGVVALKRMRMSAHDEGVPVTTLREVSLLKDLVHDNIVRLREVIPQPPKLFLVFDFLDYDLKQCLDTQFRNGMPHTLIQSCMLQILSGLAFCHGQLILHRDLKPQNVLINQQGRVKLADFGLARAFEPRRTYTQEVVTLWYRAPELLLGACEYAAAVDLWSTGCILAELTCRKPLFPGDSEIDQIFRIFRFLGTPNEQAWPGVTQLPCYQALFPKWRGAPLKEQLPQLSEVTADLLSHLICYDPPSRFDADAAIQHPFFDEVRHLPQPIAPLDSYRSNTASPPPGQDVTSPHTSQAGRNSGGGGSGGAGVRQQSLLASNSGGSMSDGASGAVGAMSTR